MKSIEFVKMVASGNDFVVMDNRREIIHGSKLRAFAKEICDRNYGAGGDGLIAVEPSKTADFKMRIINSDGSEAEMCGNGARCVVLFAKENKIAGRKMSFETLAGIIEAVISGDTVRLKMPDPTDLRREVRLLIENEDYVAHFVNTGVPHTIIYTEDLDSWDVKRLGREIRHHKTFAPEGTNVDFAEVQKGNSIRVRTYERGVEDETLACGTGVVASAVISAALKNFKSPVVCLTKGGDKLKIYFKRSGDNFTDVYLEGAAKKVFCGRYIFK